MGGGHNITKHKHNTTTQSKIKILKNKNKNKICEPTRAIFWLLYNSLPSHFAPFRSSFSLSLSLSLSLSNTNRWIRVYVKIEYYHSLKGI